MDTPILIVVPPLGHSVTIRIECDKFCRYQARVVPKVTLREAYEEYLTFRPLRPSTVKGYERAVRTYFAPFLDIDLSEIADEEILKKFVEIRDNSGAAQAALAIRVLKAIYSYACARFGIPERNPGKAIRLAGLSHSPTRKTRFIQKHDLPAWYRSVAALSSNRPGRTARDIFLVGLFLGLRKTEIMSLKWSDIDFRGRTLTARSTKNHRDHSLPLPPFLVRLFQERKREGISGECVFAGKNGKSPIRDIDDSRKKVIESAKVNFTLHDLRRTFATVSSEIGTPPYLLKKILNHKSGDVTEGYVITTPEILRGAILKIAKRIEELCRIKQDLAIRMPDEDLSASG